VEGNALPLFALSFPTPRSNSDTETRQCVGGL